MTVDDIRDHFVARLDAATLVMHPFPHLLLTDALPAEVYASVIADNPFTANPGVRFGDPSWTSRLRFTHYYDYRFQHDLCAGSRTLDQEPWSLLGDAFDNAAWLGPTLRDRFPEYFDLRFGDIGAVEQAGVDGDGAGERGGFWGRLHTRTFLQRHEPGYQLDAHTDIPTRIATCIFNFPPGAGYEQAGTQFLEPLDPRWRCTGNSHYPIDGFRVVASSPYAPNTGVVFFKTRHSWHAVSAEVSNVPGGRFGMQVQLYEPDDGALVDLSAPDLLRNGQFHTGIVAKLRRTVTRCRA